MSRRTGRILLLVGLAVLLLLVLGRVGVGFYTDVLWYRELGYLGTFWRRLGIDLGVRAVAAAVGGAVVFANLWAVTRNLGPVRVRRRYGNIEIAEQIPRRWILAGSVLVAVLGGWWLAELQFDRGSTLAVASWLAQTPWGLRDPLFGRDVGFYVLALPVAADVLAFLILVAIWTLALVALGQVLVGGIRWDENRVALDRTARLHLAALVAAMLVLLGVRYWLARYLLVVDGNGVGGGLGFTDVRARLPGYVVMAFLSVAAGAAMVWGARRASLRAPVIALGGLLLAGVVVGTAYPGFVQKFQVEPNELSREAPYIRWNMEFTRRAYGLDSMRRQAFPYRPEAAPRPERLAGVVQKLPLWDTEPLEQTFNEVQTLFRYYTFPDVDHDRYGPPGDERQVGIGVREFQPSGLAEGSRTWQTLRLNPSYIRGLGAVVAPAHAVTAGEGTPELWVRNINPVVEAPGAPSALQIERPSVFFGESMEGYVIVVPGRDGEFTGTPGVDYPEGVPLGSFLRVLAFAWRFGDETLLFSGEVTRESRLLFRRTVQERVGLIAPFLLWDNDALPVVADGRVVWLLDGYTVSSYFPMARAVAVDRSPLRYLRNSVKAAVDAVTGEVTLYRLPGDDPLLDTYQRVFPDLIQPLEAMEPALLGHLRYPELALLAQAEILQEYHLERVEAFYAGQDVWQRPQQQAAAGGMRDFRVQYALMPEPLGTPGREGELPFLGALPFIARARQNMTAVLLVRNDVERYGQLTLLEFPRDLQVPGPGQVQTVIEQDPVISPQLSLLRQRGSGVDVGHLRVLPLDSSVLYIQPLYLSADENAIPEVWRVVASDGREVSMAPTLAGALAGLQLGVDAPERERPDGPVAGEGRPSPDGPAGWPRRALEALDRAEARLRAGDWAGYGRALEELRALLTGLEGEAAGEGGS